MDLDHSSRRARNLSVLQNVLLVSDFNADKQNGCLEIVDEMTHVCIYEFEGDVKW